MKTRGPKNPNKVLLYYCIGALVALLANALAQLVRRAAAIKSENDLTI